MQTDDQQRLNQLKYKQKIQQFSRQFELYDLTLSQTYENVFFIFGQTKSGMTSLAHLLSGSSLGCTIKNGILTVEAINSQNEKAKIGHSFCSQTQVPNVFSTKLEGEQKEYHIIEGPGNEENYSLWVILRKNFLKQRLFSRMKNIKFILCFDAIQLQSSPFELLNTIIQWRNTFKDYKKKRQQIWKSVAFVITKVSQKSNIKKQLIERFRQIIKERTKICQEEASFKELIEYMIEADRIFFIKKIQNNQTLAIKDMLRTMDNKIPSWWQRQIQQTDNIIDQSEIRFDFNRQVLETIKHFPECSRQLYDMIRYYNIRKEELFFNYKQSNMKFGFIQEAFSQLTYDAMNVSEKSHNFISSMQIYVNKYYKSFDPSYHSERTQTQRMLFDLHDNFCGQSQANERQESNGRCYTVQKFKCIHQIQCLKQQINGLESNQNSTKLIIKSKIIQIMKSFNRISCNPSQTQIIHKYGYLLHRFFEESKLLTSFLQFDRHQKYIIMDEMNGEWFQYTRCVIDFMGVGFRHNKLQVTYNDIAQKFINDMDIQKQQFRKLQKNKKFIDFILSINLESGAINLESRDSNIKVYQLFINYSDFQIQKYLRYECLSLDGESGEIMRRLLNIIINLEYSYSLEKRINQNVNIFSLIKRATINLAKLLSLLQINDLSNDVFALLYTPQQVIQLYYIAIHALEKSQFIQINYQLNCIVQKLTEHIQASQYLQYLELILQRVSDVEMLHKIKQSIFRMKDLINRKIFENKVSQHEEKEKVRVRDFQKLNQNLVKRIQILFCNESK